jgi:hypothetical protein
MHFLTFDGMSVATGLLLEAGLVLICLSKGLAKLYPVLVLYLLVNMVEDPLALFWKASAPQYARFYFAITVLDYVLQLLILLEVGRNVFRPSSRSISFPTWPVVSVGILICMAVAATLSPHFRVSQLHQLSQVFLRVTLGLAILKLLMFALMAGFAQFLGIGWKNYVLQLATGLAFYGAVSMAIQIMVSHLQGANQASFVSHYVVLTRIQSLAYLTTLGFWIWAFSRNEAPRKDFTPQMQEVLVTIAQTARRTRLAVTRSGEQP